MRKDETGGGLADFERFRLPVPDVSARPGIASLQVEPTRRLPPNVIRGVFLKGPIPLHWLAAAAGLAGKGPLAVGLAIWFAAGLRKSATIRVTTALLSRFRVNRKVKYRALSALENAGLISVVRKSRGNPAVTILNVNPSAE